MASRCGTVRSEVFSRSGQVIAHIIMTRCEGRVANKKSLHSPDESPRENSGTIRCVGDESAEMFGQGSRLPIRYQQISLAQALREYPGSADGQASDLDVRSDPSHRDNPEKVYQCLATVRT